METQEASQPAGMMSRALGAIERRCQCAGDVDRREGLSPDELRKEYLIPRRPVVLTGCMDDWPALSKWSFDFFKAEYADVPTSIGRAFKKEGMTTIGEYAEYVREWRETHDDELPAELPLYADNVYVDAGTELSRDIRMPECFSKLDWFQRFWPRNPMGCGYLLMGPKGSMTKIHIDGQFVHAYVAQVVGSKRWVIVPFDQLKRLFSGYNEYIGGWPGYEPPGIEDFPGLEDVTYFTTVQKPGEIIIAPSGQFHQVINTQDSIALTNKFVDRSNARQVIWSMFLTRMGLRRSHKLGYLD